MIRDLKLSSGDSVIASNKKGEQFKLSFLFEWPFTDLDFMLYAFEAEDGNTHYFNNEGREHLYTRKKGRLLIRF